MRYDRLFTRYGVEVEYMIADRKTLDILPIADKVIHAIAGQYLNEVICGRITYSNELALHVIELKTEEREPSLLGVEVPFQQHVQRINALLDAWGACLLPTAVHPWMDPHHEMRLWPHDSMTIYEKYHRIFDCRGHGWSNLQSAHLNLPFYGDEEFSRLHSAIRALLPIMPALAASSPILEGRLTGTLDTRLEIYRQNQARIPEIVGRVVPEAVHSCEEYQQKILDPMYTRIRPHDPEGILQYEWLNSRGAIARFERSTIEIRILDVQECPLADIAIATAIVEVLKKLVRGDLGTWEQIRDFPLDPLADIFLRVMRLGEQAVITENDYLALFGVRGPKSARALWETLLSLCELGPYAEPLQLILQHGSLASRIMRSCQESMNRSTLRSVYARLADCLAQGEMFFP